MADELHRDLAALVGAEHVRVPRAGDLEDATRWSGLRGSATVFVEPADAESVARVVRHCYAAGVPVTARGGGTGLSGGAVPAGGIVLSLARLNRVRSLDPQWWRVEVEAGVVTAELQRRVREVGLRFPPDPGAAESSQIGGNLATNAGGPHAFGHGVMRSWVLGLEAVLAPGTLVQLGGPVRKDVAGYDLVSLLVGSEGTLGVITAAWLRLVPPPLSVQSVLAIFATPAVAQAALGAALTCGAVPASLELLDGGALTHCAATLPVAGAAAAWRGLPDPERGVLLLANLEGELVESTAARGDALCEAWSECGAVWTAAVEQGSSGAGFGGEAGALDRWRAAVPGAVAARLGGKLSEDSAVPTDQVGALLEGSAAIARRHRLEHAAWGHAGDGNLHCSFLLDPADPAMLVRADAAAEELFALTRELGGTISGEHGLGRLKSHQLSAQWAPAAVAAHDAIKAALDPKGLLNPGCKLA